VAVVAAAQADMMMTEVAEVMAEEVQAGVKAAEGLQAEAKAAAWADVTALAEAILSEVMVIEMMT